MHKPLAEKIPMKNKKGEESKARTPISNRITGSRYGQKAGAEASTERDSFAKTERISRSELKPSNNVSGMLSYFSSTRFWSSYPPEFMQTQGVICKKQHNAQ